MRAEGWEKALAAELHAARDRPFEWGRHDCVTWAYLVTCRLRGDAPDALWLGRYSTALGAKRAMRAAGVADAQEAATAHLGAPLSTVLLAQRGDVVLRDGALGVCAGAKVAFVTDAGLVWHRLRDCAAAWRV